MSHHYQKSANINTIDYSNVVHYGCYSCGRNCIDCKYLKDKDEYYFVMYKASI